MNKKMKLYLVTDHFPYGRAEKSFLLPELSCLKEQFDIVILSNASEQERECKDQETILSEEIKVYPVDSTGYTLREQIIASFRSLFSSAFHKEVRKIRRECQNSHKGKLTVFKLSLKALGFHALADFYRKKVQAYLPADHREPFLAYTFWNRYHTLAFLQEKKNRPNMKVVSRIHGYDLYNERVSGLGYQFYKTYMAEQLDHLYFACEAAHRYYVKTFLAGKNHSNLSVSYLGVPPKQAKSRVSTDETFRIVSCSNVIPLKRVHLIASALEKLDESVSVIWTHAGDGEQLSKLRKLAARIGQAHSNLNIRLLGYVDNDDWMKYFMKQPVDLFITTSETEGGTPVSIQEALSFGVPVVGTDVGGVAEAICQTGVLLPEDVSPAEIAEAIMRIRDLSDAAKEQMRKRAYSLWATHFNSERNAAVFTASLCEICGMENPCLDGVSVLKLT